MKILNQTLMFRERHGPVANGVTHKNPWKGGKKVGSNTPKSSEDDCEKKIKKPYSTIKAKVY